MTFDPSAPSAPGAGAGARAGAGDGAADRKLRTLEKKLLRKVVRASRDFGMIEAGDRVMVCISGGKDSYAMLHLIHAMRRRAPFDFSIIAVNLDQKQPGFPAHIIPQWCADNSYDFHQVTRNTYGVVTDKIAEGKTYCSLCSRLRRGILYATAVELGATKIALGHHRDDIIETLLLNIFYAGQLKAMPPKLHSDDGRNVVIRPLAYCAEADVADFAEQMAFPIIPCDLCGSQQNLQRKKVKTLIAQLNADNPKVSGNLFAALGNVRASHLLDQGLWQRLGMNQAEGIDPGIAEIEGSGDDDAAFGPACGGPKASSEDAVAAPAGLVQLRRRRQ